MDLKIHPIAEPKPVKWGIFISRLDRKLRCLYYNNLRTKIINLRLRIFAKDNQDKLYAKLVIEVV